MHMRMSVKAGWAHWAALSCLTVGSLVIGARADSRLNDLKKRKVDLDRMETTCEAKQDPARSQCLANRQKLVDKYKEDLEAYKVDLAKQQEYAASHASNEDLQTSIANRQKSIDDFMAYVNSCTEKSARCASALFQVANLTYENEEDAFLIVEAKYEKQYQRWEDHDEKGPTPVQPHRDHRTALRLFDRFLKEYPNNKQAPEALIRSAFIADVMGNDDQAYEYLNLLVTRFPDNPLAIPAYLRLGEYWLAKHQYAKAIADYEKVPLDYPGNEAGLALYHRAEAYYDMADFENAAKWYYEYVDLADHHKIKGDLRDEAQEFMAAAWADMDNGFEVAQKFLADHGHPSWENDVYYEIGVKNKDHDREDESVKAFQFLLNLDPTYPKAPEADLDIVEILALQKKGEEAQQARMAMIQRYADGSAWFNANAGNTEAVAKAKLAIRQAMYAIPVYYHQKGSEGQGDTDMLRKAESGYQAFLNRYGTENSWDVYQVHQNLAVLYDKLQEYDQASQEWKWCASANLSLFGKIPDNKKGLITKQDAGFNAVLMMDKARKLALQNKYNNDTTAAFHGPETQAYFDCVSWYMGLYGNSNSAPEIAYNAAIIDYEAKQYDAAVKDLSSLIARFPNHQHAVLIRRALAQSLLESGHYDEAATQFTILEKKLCPADKQCAEIKKALASTVFKQAEALHEGNNLAGAAEKFGQLANNFRDVDIADRALFEAGVNYDSAGNMEQGVRLLLRIPQEYPKSSLHIKAILKAAAIYMDHKKFRDAAETFLLIPKNFRTDSLAEQSVAWAADAYEKAADTNKAAQTYESTYKLYPKDSKTPGFLYNAGQDYEAAKQYGDAISVYNLLSDKYPSSQFAAEAAFSVPLLLDKKGEYAKAAAAYEAFTRKYDQDKVKLLRAHLGAGTDYEKAGNDKKALDQYEECIDIQKKEGSNIPPALAAEAAYRAGDIYFKRISGIELDGTKAQNGRKFKIIQENLKPAVQNFAKAVQYAEEEWTLRATLRMGDLFFAIGNISNNERVAGLSADDRVRARIQSKAGVPDFLDKAKEIYKKNLDIGLNQNIQSPWIDTAGIRFLQCYAIKGQTLEDLSKLFLEVKLPRSATAADKAQFKQASDDSKSKAIDDYREALNMAQTYHLDNDTRNRIVSRLRELEPTSTELQPQVSAKAMSADSTAVDSGSHSATGIGADSSANPKDSSAAMP